MRRRLKKVKILVIVLSGGLVAEAAWSVVDDVMAALIRDARQGAPAYQPSVERGERIFREPRVSRQGEKVSCMTCHTENPTATGRTRANKDVKPLAPVANPDRFTDLAKVEKWFKRNCQDVFERVCTAQEKADFAAYMKSVR